MDNKKLFEELLKADGIDPAGATNSERTAFIKILDEQLKSKHTKLGTAQPNIWRIIMNSKITKYAAAAIVLVAVGLSITVFDKTMPSAYAIERTIEAYNSIRFLQVRQFKAKHDEPLEYWIKSDDQGGIEKARYYLPEHVSPGDGAKLITWTPEKAELWFKRKNGYLIFQSKKIEGMMQYFLQQSQPKLVMEKLLKDQEEGVVDIDIETPQEKQKPVTVTATDKAKPSKTIYYINQATDLITSVETYEVKDGGDVLVSTTEYYDYNVPIDEKMFSIADEIPEGVTVVDQLNQLIGVPQGEMTYEQAAVETVRQFFQALIDKDYKKAGLIVSGISEEKAKEYFADLNVTAIISLGTPEPRPQNGKHSFKVPCELEVTKPDGEKTTWVPYGPFTRCGDDEMHPDRWIIHGGI